jgi:hypothetical protein
MGTIIAFDVLSFMAEDNDVRTFITMGSPLGLPIVISKIAEHSRNLNQGHIQLKTPESVKKHWYNFSDIDDNIALDYNLNDDFEPNTLGIEVIDVLVTNNYSMNGVANPHKSFGYLRTPEFIKTVIEFIEDKEPTLHKKIIRKARKVYVQLTKSLRKKD